MRILFLAFAAASQSRLAPAVLGMAARGHEVTWVGGIPVPATAAMTHARRIPWGTTADIVVAAGRPLLPAMAGAWCAARALVLDPAPGSWNAPQRIAWSMLDSVAVVPPSKEPRNDPWSAGRTVMWNGDTPGDGRPDHEDVETLERACERLHARRFGFAPRPAAFLDRDGTMVVEHGHLSDPERIELLPGVAMALRELRAMGFALVVVSNQAGVGRGLYPLERAYATMARLRTLLRREGVELDAIHFCPHHPDAGCTCRKPGGDLVRRAVAELHLDLKASAMIGDKRIDVETGHRLGMAGILVRTGYGATEEGLGFAGGRPPDCVVRDLAAAAAWLIARGVQRSSVSS